MTSRLDIATTPASELADCTPPVAFFLSSYRGHMHSYANLVVPKPSTEMVFFRSHAGEVAPWLAMFPHPFVRAISQERTG